MVLRRGGVANGSSQRDEDSQMIPSTGCPALHTRNCGWSHETQIPRHDAVAGAKVKVAQARIEQ